MCMWAVDPSCTYTNMHVYTSCSPLAPRRPHLECRVDAAQEVGGEVCRHHSCAWLTRQVGRVQQARQQLVDLHMGRRGGTASVNVCSHPGKHPRGGLLGRGVGRG